MEINNLTEIKHNEQSKSIKTYQIATSQGNPCKQALS